ncbi:TPA: IpaD/SipD/SspD family type III secretion system needle tip protein [Yersinia enterocolitica]|nr:IpaD/SipD/SspD family type III secretion system needle tip protein [Yersinia enterocolitica]HEN3482245.1 IpaD/SipD/SspD family type III secretion system needle tip protein [Yersinia enterocolitica]
MATSIAQPQHTLVSMCGMNTPLANNQEANGQTVLLQKIDLSALQQSHADLYDCGKQVVEQNKHLLASPPSEPSLPGFHSTSSADFEAVLVDSKQLVRDFNLSDDDYMAMGRSLARAKAEVNQSPPHINALEKLIGSIHTDYQQTYAKINEKAAEFMRDVNTAVGKISDFIKAGGDGKINFRPGDFLESLDKTFAKYTSYTKTEMGNYKKWSPDDNSTKPIYTFSGDNAEFNFWQKKLGDGYIVKRSTSGGEIQILPNLSAIRNIYSSVANSEASWGGSDMNSASFQSLQSAIDSQKNTVNSSVSQLLEKFRQDNSTFETLIQLLQQMTKDLHHYNAGYCQ